MQDGSVLAIFEEPPRNLVLAGEPDTFVISGIGEETVEHPNAVRVSVDPIVKADQHHPTPCKRDEVANPNVQ
jgi:hypothetical protein